MAVDLWFNAKEWTSNPFLFINLLLNVHLLLNVQLLNLREVISDARGQEDPLRSTEN